jgi:formylglycine-generating enzyme required for sulfatase activity
MKHLLLMFVAATLHCDELLADVPSGMPFVITTIVRSGDEPPGRVGESFSTFGTSDPSLNDAGVVVFKGNFEGPASGNEGVYAFDGSLHRIVDDSFDFIPPGQGGVASWSSFGSPVVNSSGHVLFRGTFSFGDNSQGLYRHNGATLEVLFDDRPTQNVPGQPDATFTTFPLGAGVLPVLGSMNTSATAAQFAIGPQEFKGVYFISTTGVLLRVADDTMTPPGQPLISSFEEFDYFLAVGGDVAIRATYSDGEGTVGVYRYAGDEGELVRVADGSMSPPGQPVTARFADFGSFPSMNSVGTIAFVADYAQGIGSQGVYRAADGILEVVVDNSGNYEVPGRPGVVFTGFGSPVINETGAVCFAAVLGGDANSGGLFIVFDGVVAPVIGLSDAVPGQPDASFFAIGQHAINARGHVACTARYSGGVGDEGVYFFDGTMLYRVIDESESRFGAVTNFHMSLGTGGSGGADGKPTSLNAHDQIAFRASVDGGEGIFLATPAFATPDLVLIPGTDPQPGGPAYDFEIARFETTNSQFVIFLNDAEFHNEAQHPGFGDERGDNLLFRLPPQAGDVGLPQGDSSDVDAIFDISRSVLTYNVTMLVGTRYGVEPELADHPIVGASWMGAVKYCNWRTIVEGLGLGERCYAEGPSEVDWFPVVIGDEFGSQAETNVARDLTESERAVWLRSYRGYRLPMDQGGTSVGASNAEPRPYNEWYKAAAFDLDGPAVARILFEGFPFEEHAVPPQHWAHGFGRDTLADADANYRDSGDPFDDPDPSVIATTPVGYYDGSDHGGAFSSNADENGYGLRDISGNVWELLSDQVALTDSLTPDRAIAGGSYRSNARQVSCANRGDIGPGTTRPVVGFRLARVQFNPYATGDFDLDGDVDLVDYAAFQQCYSGIAEFWNASCEVFDFDGDVHIRVDDNARFIVVWE